MSVLVKAAVGGDFPYKLRPALASRWVIPGWYSHAYSTGATIANRSYYIPIFVTEATTYIAIGINVSTLKVGQCDLRVFRWTNGLPGAQLLNAGTVDTGTTGDKEIAVSLGLTRGYYFLAFRCTSNPNLRTPGVAQAADAPVPGINIGGPGTQGLPGVILIVDAPFSDPAPTPTGMGFISNVAVWLKEA